MPNRTNPLADPAAAEAIGEVRGQLRELIHSVNNQGQQNEAIGKALAKLEDVPKQLAQIELRLTQLETDKHRRDGAIGLGGMLLKSPLVGWIAGFGVAIYVWLRGQGT